MKSDEPVSPHVESDAAASDAVESESAESDAAESDGSAGPEPEVLDPLDVAAVARAVEEARAERKAKEKKKKKDKDKLGSSRGVETMFRTSYRVHMDLSALADTKANIMISINGLILPIILAAISPKIDSNPWLLIPTTVLLIGCLISMVFAIRAARPRVNEDPITLDQIRRNSANILFFGHFANMSRDDFETGMTELMQDNDQLYRNMIRDLYGLGSVLTLKFKLLRSSYTVFMISIVTGVLLFIGTYYLVATEVIGLEPVPVVDLAPSPNPLP